MKKIGGEIRTNMSKRGRKREKIGRMVLARCVVICTVAAIISSLAIPVPVLAALQAEDPVTITVNAPDYVEEPFNVTIDVDNIMDFNSVQFDLSFNSSVVNVTDVRDGEIDGEAVPIFMWSFVDAGTVRVLVSMPMGVGVSGSGNLAEVEFKVKGKSGDKSTLDISNGMLVDTEAEEIDAGWYGDEVTVLRAVVSVDAPEYVNKAFNATTGIDNVTDLNSGQFDLSFNSSVVNVTDVRDGEIDGEAVPIYMWNFVDADTVRVLISMPMGVGVSGSGNLAEVEFEVKGRSGDKSELDIFNGLLVDTEAKEIEAEWYGDEVTVLWTVVSVDAPEYVTDTFNAIIRIENVTELNSGQFDLSFDSSVVNVTDVEDGEIDGETVPIYMWNFVDADTVRVLVSMPMGVGVSGTGNLAKVEFEVKGKSGDKSTLDISNGLLVDTEAKEIDADWYDDEVTVKAPIFDTGEGTYPSISGMHEGTITPSKDIPVQKMYTYPCIGTGGHSEYVKIWNATWEGIEAHWIGYIEDYHNITFSEPFTLEAGKMYNYTIKTGSYPQICHTDEFEVESGAGTIRCTKFTDANGKVYGDWIPAIKLW